jgi:ribosomal protein S18 acetylase RimI-like enzyme
VTTSGLLKPFVAALLLSSSPPDTMNKSQIDTTVITRASLDQLDEAFDIVSEYYHVENIVLRDTKEYFEKYFADNAGVFLAKQYEKLVGCVVLRPLDESAGHAEMKRLYVRPEYRGLGIAEKLVNAMHAYAQKYGYSWCYLDTADDCTAAIRLYGRHGYKMCERYNENPEATMFMRKQLDDQQ